MAVHVIQWLVNIWAGSYGIYLLFYYTPRTLAQATSFDALCALAGLLLLLAVRVIFEFNVQTYRHFPPDTAL
jgi:hypothetical protein